MTMTQKQVVQCFDQIDLSTKNCDHLTGMISLASALRAGDLIPLLWQLRDRAQQSPSSLVPPYTRVVLDDGCAKVEFRSAP